MSKTQKWSLFFVILLALSGCNLKTALEETPDSTSTQSGAEGTTEWETSPAQVDSFEIQLQGPAPLKITLLVSGTLPDTCTEIGAIHQVFDNGRFIIDMTARHPAGAVCADSAPTPFEHAIPLEGYSLQAGTYTVDVNGLTETFSLDEDMVAESSTLPGTQTIGGRVFHDECAVLKDSSGTVLDSSDGCTQQGDNYTANGTLDEQEKGIEGILVSLGRGECPASGLTETTTKTDGAFSFTNISEGSYCVSIDPQNSQNRPLLVPGVWTTPSEEGTLDVTVAGSSSNNLRFGWDYEFLPVIDETDCENSFDFVNDVTIPDDTEMSAGDVFEKTWRIENTGTCTWSTDYSLIFTDGDHMGAADSVPLPERVEPGDTVDVSVSFTAPSADGSYRSDWQMQTPGGNIFGTGRDRNLPVWVQIKVGTVTNRPDFGAADYVEQFNSGTAWYIGEDSHTSFSVQNGKMVMVGKNPESWDGWSITSAYLSDFYIEMKVETGTCGGLDRYGLIVRAPDTNSGYLIGFSCNGQYSVRLWDGENFQTLRDWTASSHIKSGSNQTNRLGILAEGNSFTIYANDILLAEITSSTYSEGRYGVFVASSATNNFQARVDSISYWTSP
ncbi:MAG: hypothetical protein JXA25_07735 [Anaerolineales bacterium]|nr:hypothetical protein [Anaerolineales bacterium]